MHEMIQFLLRHGSSVLWIWVLAESLGVPAPSVPILMATGTLIGNGGASFAASMWLVISAATIGDSVWYALGRTKGHSVLKLLCRISIEPDSCVNSSRNWFTRLGVWALAIMRFIPGLSAVAAPLAGLSRMPWWKFLAADWIGISLWGGVYIGIGYYFRNQIEDVAQLIHQMGLGFAVVVSVPLLWFGWKIENRRRFFKSLRIARITAEEALERLDDYIVLDLRGTPDVNRDGQQIPGALWFDHTDLKRNHQLIPRDREILLYCT